MIYVSKTSKILLVIVIFGFGLLYLFIKTPKDDSLQRDFECEQKLIDFFKLKPINTSIEYYSNSYMRIFDDTLVKCVSVTKKSGNWRYGYYFIQSMLNPVYKKYVDASEWFVSFSPIDYYKNGYLYTGRFGRSYMERIGIDGSYKTYFKKYDDTMFYINDLFFYKNKTVIVSMNGIFLFDTENEKLLYKFKYPHNHVELQHQCMVGKYFIFTAHSHKKYGAPIFIYCLDMEKGNIIWKKYYKNAGFTFEYDPNINRYRIPSNKHNEIVICTYTGIDIFDVSTGKVMWTFTFQKPKTETTFVYIDSTTCYYRDDDTIYAIDFKRDKLLWKTRTPTVAFRVFRNYLFGLGLGYINLINMKTGVEEAVIPQNGIINFEKIDDYIKIDSTLYK